MKMDENPFANTNTINAVFPKVKAKILTSARAKESGAVDPRLQMTVEEYREIKQRREK